MSGKERHEREGAGMVVTMLEARITAEKETDLVREYAGPSDELPPFIIETFLVRATDSDVWRIVTVWRSREDLESYRASVETPEGVRVFRAVGAEPTLTVFDVITHATR
jgi:heme-degrading monooxygenase HmoA